MTAKWGEEQIWVGSREWIRREEEKKMNEVAKKLREIMAPPVAPVGAKEKERCEFCLFFAPLHSSTCFHWVAEPKPTPSTHESDLQRTLSTGFHSCLTITEDDTDEGRRLVSGCPDENLREFSRSWVARAEARQRLADEAIAIIRQIKPQPDSSSIPEIELELRRMMWLGHGHTGMYGDDGEMQCMECQPYGVVDYRGEPLDKVRETFRAVQMKRMMNTRDSSSISTEQTFEEWWDKSVQPDYFRDLRTMAKQAWNAAKGQR